MPATQGDPRTQTSVCSIKLDGSELRQEIFDNLAEVTIEQDLILPDAFAVRFLDISTQPGSELQTLFPLLDGDEFRVGKSIEIGLGRESAARSVLHGEVTGLELEMRADGVPSLTIRGYDRAHRLNREKKTRVFKNQKVSDVVRTVAQGCGLRASVSDTKQVYPHLIQDSQTDWEFVRSLARQIGKEAFVRDSALSLQDSVPGGTGVELNFGTTLRQLRMRLSASAQVTRVQVRGWDPVKKASIEGQATVPVQTTPKDKGKHGGEVAQAAFGTGAFVLNDQVVSSVTDANQRAQSILDEIANGFIQLDLVCLGDPQLRPGSLVRLKGVSRRFTGDFYISSCTHQLTPDRGYVMHVIVSGRQPNSLTSLVSSNGARPGMPAAAKASVTHAGVVVGIVTNNKDPDMGGRVKVKYPWADATLESDWARIAAPMAGSDRGFFWLPEVDDEVLVAFEHGDINRPYVLGGLWNGRDKPPDTAANVVGADGKVNKRVIKSRSGHVITIDDTSGAENITVVDKTGKNTIKLESPVNKVTVSVDGDMVLEALKGNISMKGRTVAVEASQALSIKGMSVSAEATQALTAKGMTTEIKGTTSAKMNGATVDVQAQAKLSLSGTAMTEVKGGVIRLN